MSYVEKSSLLAFITGQEFFGRKEEMKVICIDQDDERCSKAQVCFNILILQRYRDLETEV
jgi:hypothetical protein